MKNTVNQMKSDVEEETDIELIIPEEIRLNINIDAPIPKKKPLD